MKNALLKIGIIAALLFTTALFKKELYHFLPCKKVSYSVQSPEKCPSYRRLLFLNHENFKTYFIGLKTIVKSIESFQKDFFINAIHSHPFYIGRVDKAIPNKKNQIYESVDSEGNLHFYIQHSKGTRHFSIGDVKIGDHVTYKLDNATIGGYYPSLDSLLECTLA